jgi:MoxR-like ATPase
MAEIDEIKQINEWAIVPTSFNDTYLATVHVKDKKLIIPSDVLQALKDALDVDNVYVGNDEVLKEIITGVIKGNIILQGPPGTGKTTIARIICDVFNVNAMECTAISDWTTYDTIGGLQPSVNDDDKEIINPKNGKIVDSLLECFNVILEKEEYGGAKQASWLIIDELNRCEIDKVFGDLFTVFGSDSQDSEKSIPLWFENDKNKRKIYVPARYRIIGAMNNIDKNFVSDISQGLSRRFTFITILPPEEKDFDEELKRIKEKAVKRVCSKLVEYSGVEASEITTLMDDSVFKEAELIMCNFLKHVRYDNDEKYLGLQIGTAQIIDVYENILLNMVLFGYENVQDKKMEIYSIVDSTLCNRIVPQMDGFDYEKINTFYTYLTSDGEYVWLHKTKESVKKKL